MWLDVIALGLLGFFALMGLLRGALASGLSLIGLGVAYAAAFVAAAPLGSALAEAMEFSRVAAIPLAGTLAFAGVWLGFGLFAWIVRRVAERRRGQTPRTGLDRAGGALFGAVRGFVVVLLIGWLSLWLDALRSAGQAPWLPEAGPSAAGRVTQTLIETGVEAVLSDSAPTALAAARFAARPARNVERLRSVIDDPRIAELRDDQIFWTHVEYGDIDAALNRASFAAIAYDEGLRGDLARLGLASEAAAEDPAAFRIEMSRVLEDVGPRIRRLRDDPELARLVENPATQQMVASGDTLGLLGDRGFQRLVERVLLAPEGAAPAGDGRAPPDDVVVTNYRF